MENDTKAQQTSGRFLLRIQPELHLALRAAAREAEMSLNEYCARKLAAPETGPADEGGEAVKRALAAHREDLIGVVLFGSWARGRTTSSSDVDLLLVVEERVAIGRNAYRAWDEAPMSWAGRPVGVHLVHLPPAGSRVSGLWAEVAVDGVVLFERELRVSRRLVEVREELAAGRLVRRRVHGQPYWIEAA
jgi:predicted nucleotidyltransferase